MANVVGLAVDGNGCGHLDAALVHIVVAEARAREYGDHYQRDDREAQALQAYGRTTRPEVRLTAWLRPRRRAREVTVRFGLRRKQLQSRPTNA